MFNYYETRLFVNRTALPEILKECLRYIIDVCCEKKIDIVIQHELSRRSFDLIFYDVCTGVKCRRYITFNDPTNPDLEYKQIDAILTDVFGYFEQERVRKNCMKLALNSIYGVGGVISMNNPTIKKVIFNDPYTIVLWSDRTKTIVKCGDGDDFDKEKGLAMAVSKKFLGTNESHSNYFDIFKEWIEKSDKEEAKHMPELDALNALKKFKKEVTKWERCRYDILKGEKISKVARELDSIVNACPCSNCSDDVKMTCKKCDEYYNWIDRLKEKKNEHF